MSYEAEEKAIHDRFRTQWANRTAIKYGSMEFTEPQEENRQYAAIFIQNQQSRQIDIGTAAPLARFPGFVVIMLLGNPKFGTRPLKRLGDIVAGIFRRQTIILPGSAGVMTFGMPTVTEQPTVLNWAQINVDIPFRRDTRT